MEGDVIIELSADVFWISRTQKTGQKSSPHQLHEAAQLSDGLREVHQFVVAGVEDPQR